MLDFEEFKEKARQFQDTIPDWLHRWKLEGLDNPDETFFVSWVTGGIGGRSMWGHSSEFYLEAEKEPELDNLIDFLEAHVGVGLRHGKMILDLARTVSHTERGEYQNRVDYDFKYVSYQTVYDKLAELGYAYPRDGAPKP